MTHGLSAEGQGRASHRRKEEGEERQAKGTKLNLEDCSIVRHTYKVTAGESNTDITEVFLCRTKYLSSR